MYSASQCPSATGYVTSRDQALLFSVWGFLFFPAMILYQPVAEISGIQIFLRNQNKTGFSLYFNATSAQKVIHGEQDVQIQSWKCIETGY